MSGYGAHGSGSPSGTYVRNNSRGGFLTRQWSMESSIMFIASIRPSYVPTSVSFLLLLLLLLSASLRFALATLHANELLPGTRCTTLGQTALHDSIGHHQFPAYLGISPSPSQCDLPSTSSTITLWQAKEAAGDLLDESGEDGLHILPAEE